MIKFGIFKRKVSSVVDIETKEIYHVAKSCKQIGTQFPECAIIDFFNYVEGIRFFVHLYI